MIRIICGTYVRNFFVLPTIVLHDGDVYKSLELAWLIFFVGFKKDEEESNGNT